MYNCARLATLFEGYEHGMEQGLYPAFPLVSSLDFSLLHDEVSVRPYKRPQAKGWTCLPSTLVSHRVSGCCFSTVSFPSWTC